MNPRYFICVLGCMLVAASCATDAAKSAANAPAKARNVILFVGDGMGIATVTATRILDGQRRGGQGEDNVLSFEKFPYTAFSKTYTYDFQVGESAGTITAMMSGQKTHSAVLGEGPAVTPGKCEGAAAASIATLLEEAADRGLATGVVTTTRITHATPGRNVCPHAESGLGVRRHHAARSTGSKAAATLRGNWSSSVTATASM